jgi:hypothetical protein
MRMCSSNGSRITPQPCLLTDLKRITSPVVLASMNYTLARAKERDYSLGRLRSLRRMVGMLPLTR